MKQSKINLNEFAHFDASLYLSRKQVVIFASVPNELSQSLTTVDEIYEFAADDELMMMRLSQAHIMTLGDQKIQAIRLKNKAFDAEPDSLAALKKLDKLVTVKMSVSAEKKEKFDKLLFKIAILQRHRILYELKARKNAEVVLAINEVISQLKHSLFIFLVLADFEA